MSKTELQSILGYLNIGLAVAHNIGLSAGHFGSTDFLQLAQGVNSLLLNAIAPQPAAAPALPIAVATVAASAVAPASQLQ